MKGTPSQSGAIATNTSLAFHKHNAGEYPWRRDSRIYFLREKLAFLAL